LSTVGRCWQIAGFTAATCRQVEPEIVAGLARWADTARQNERRLLALLDAIHLHQIPSPIGSYESMLQYDRQRVLKQQLLHTAIATAVDMRLASGTLRGAQATLGAAPRRSASDIDLADEPQSAAWEPQALRLEQALLQGDSRELQTILPSFVRRFRSEPLLIIAQEEGGQPRDILR